MLSKRLLLKSKISCQKTQQNTSVCIITLALIEETLDCLMDLLYFFVYFLFR